MAIQFLDVGMGDCTLVQMPPWDAGPLMLVDFGEASSPMKVAAVDALNYLILTITNNYNERAKDPVFAAAHKLPFLDYLVITHADRDHWNKLDWLIEGRVTIGKKVVHKDLWTTLGKWPAQTKLQIGKLIFGGKWSDYSKMRAAIIKAATLDYRDELGDRYRGKAASPWLELPAHNGEESVKVDILSANFPTKDSPDKNSKSIVLRVSHGSKFKAILAGDATAETEAEIVNKSGAADLEAYVLKLSHHGSADSNTTEWLEAVKPKAILASGDAKWGHPYCEAINRAIKVKSIKGGTANNRYVCANNAASAKRDPQLDDYHNNETKAFICTNLWYVVKDAEFKAKGDDGKSFTGKKGFYTGVQWECHSLNGVVKLNKTDTWPKA